MKLKHVSTQGALDQLAVVYAQQGYTIVRPNPGRVEAYNAETGELVKIAVTP